MEFLYSMLYLLVISLACFFAGRLYPKRWVFENKFPFRSFKLENDGAIYNKIGIAGWKTKLPDMSMLLGSVFPRFIPKKRVESSEKVPVLIKETCIAEATHFIAGVLGFGCVFIWRGLGGKILSFLYFIGNLPFIIIQRYNRPRLKKTYEMLQRRKSI